MLRRLRRPLSLLVPALLSAGLLASCGSSPTTEPFGPTADRLDAVSITGDVGSEPQVAWTSQMTATTLASTTLVDGDGAALKAGDQVLVNYWIGDGFTKKSALYDTFAPTSPAVEVTVGQIPVPKPTTVTDLLSDTVSTLVKPGVKEDTRLAVTVSASAIFGASIPTDALAKDIGSDDALLIIVDVQRKVLTGPAGTQRPAPRWAPKIVVTKGEPSSLKFKGTPALGSALKVGVLRKGTGPVVAKGQQIVVNYLGQLPTATKPFDESYSKSPYPTAIGEGTVVKGWDQGLVGQTVGSRVILGIPPALGYGAKGQGSSIPGNATLYFVIDILGAA